MNLIPEVVSSRALTFFHTFGAKGTSMPCNPQKKGGLAPPVLIMFPPEGCYGQVFPPPIK